MKKLLCVFLLAIILIPANTARATVCGLWSERFTALVDDTEFSPWGYHSASSIYLCLRDMAYMFRDTPAQFDIREPLDSRWDFWIVRGETYTTDGTEFLPILEERWATRSDMGYRGFLFGWEGKFDEYPEQTMIIGIDGTDEPATSIAVRIVFDPDNTYFHTEDMGRILGFDAANFMQHEPVEPVIEGFSFAITTETRPPAQLAVWSAEFARLLVHLAGHWVDERHFYSAEIDESVVFPSEFLLSYHGFNIPLWSSAASIRPEWTREMWEQENLWHYPISERVLENGLVEMTIDEPQFYGYRIIAEPHQQEKLTLYIGDEGYTMRRFRSWYQNGDNPARYTVHVNEYGHVVLRYVFGQGAFTQNTGLLVSRATHADYLGFRNDFSEMLLHHETVSPDRNLFEFIDTTALPGQVYYYSVERLMPWRQYHPDNAAVLDFVIRADVDALTAEFLQAQAANESPAETSHTLNLLFILLLVLVILVGGIIAVYFWYVN